MRPGNETLLRLVDAWGLFVNRKFVSLCFVLAQDGTFQYNTRL